MKHEIIHFIFIKYMKESKDTLITTSEVIPIL